MKQTPSFYLSYSVYQLRRRDNYLFITYVKIGKARFLDRENTVREAALRLHQLPR